MQNQSRLIAKGPVLEFVREGDEASGQVVYVDGKPVKRRPLFFTAKGNLQPLSAQELLLVAEGDRVKEQYSLFTLDDVRLNDKARFHGKVFQVQAVRDWMTPGAPRGAQHKQCRLMLVDTTDAKWPKRPDQLAEEPSLLVGE